MRRARCACPSLNSTLIIYSVVFCRSSSSAAWRRMLIPLGIAFIVALVASTVVALTPPVCCGYLLGRDGRRDGPCRARHSSPCGSANNIAKRSFGLLAPQRGVCIAAVLFVVTLTSSSHWGAASCPSVQ